jgi:predicted RNA-binding Zn ribbon-like protein
MTTFLSLTASPAPLSSRASPRGDRLTHLREIEADLVLTRAAGAEARTKARDPLTAEHEVTAAKMQETDASFRASA